MNIAQAVQKPVLKTAQKVEEKAANETKYTLLSKEDALAMTAEVIEKYRPALAKLAE
jgi:hypothetical protein